MQALENQHQSSLLHITPHDTIPLAARSPPSSSHVACCSYRIMGNFASSPWRCPKPPLCPHSESCWERYREAFGFTLLQIVSGSTLPSAAPRVIARHLETAFWVPKSRSRMRICHMPSTFSRFPLLLFDIKHAAARERPTVVPMVELLRKIWGRFMMLHGATQGLVCWIGFIPRAKVSHAIKRLTGQPSQKDEPASLWRLMTACAGKPDFRPSRWAL